MLFQDKMELRNDDGSREEVDCYLFDFPTNDGIIKCGVHESKQHWTDFKCDISEVTSGCRLCGLELDRKKLNATLVKKAVEEFVKEHGALAIIERIKERQSR